MPQPHFLGTESSANPVVPELTRLARSLGEAGFPDGTVSARYGPRLTVNVAGVSLKALTPGDFVEVADYDVNVDRLVCIGSNPPGQDAAVHQLVYRAKKEVMVLLQVALPADHPARETVAGVDRGDRPLDTAMNVLGALREHEAVVLDGTFLLVPGLTLPEAEERVRRLTAPEGGATG